MKNVGKVSGFITSQTNNDFQYFVCSTLSKLNN